MELPKGTPVYYHGSKTAFHGLYRVVWRTSTLRYTLQRIELPDAEEPLTLYGVNDYNITPVEAGALDPKPEPTFVPGLYRRIAEATGSHAIVWNFRTEAEALVRSDWPDKWERVTVTPVED